MDYFTFHLHGRQSAEALSSGGTSWVEIRSAIGTVNLPADNVEHAKRIADAINGDKAQTAPVRASILEAAE